MVKIIPFKAVLYNKAKVKPEQVIVPPYDVFDDKKKEEYFALSDYNFAKIIKPISSEDAAKNLNSWIKDEILVADEKPGFYTYTQHFDVEGIDGEKIQMQRNALICLVRIEEFENRIILDHEKTFAKTVGSRLELIKSIKANTGQIFGIYSDGKGVSKQVLEASSDEMFTFNDEFGIKHELSVIRDEKTLKEIATALAEARVLIADGHHRYESTLKYRNFMREGNPSYTGNEVWNYVMMSLVSEDDEGLVILPMNRLIRNVDEVGMDKVKPKLEKYFEVTVVDTRESMLKEMRKAKTAGSHVFGLHCKEDDKHYLLTLKNTPEDYEELKNVVAELKKTDVRILHTLLLEHVFGITEKMISENEDKYVKYAKGDSDTLKLTKTGEFAFSIYLNPISLKETWDVSGAGYVMERKTTCFYPKVYSGLTISDHSSDRGE